MVDAALNERPHIIDNKEVDPKRAMPREVRRPFSPITKSIVSSVADYSGIEEIFVDCIYICIYLCINT